MKRTSILLSALICIFLLPLNTQATRLIFETGQFSFQALRTIGYAVNDGAGFLENPRKLPDDQKLQSAPRLPSQSCEVNTIGNII